MSLRVPILYAVSSVLPGSGETVGTAIELLLKSLLPRSREPVSSDELPKDGSAPVCRSRGVNSVEVVLREKLDGRELDNICYLPYKYSSTDLQLDIFYEVFSVCCTMLLEHSPKTF